MAGKGKEPSFEEAMKGLESVVARLESGEAPLEESIRLFEEGMKLSEACRIPDDRRGVIRDSDECPAEPFRACAGAGDVPVLCHPGRGEKDGNHKDTTVTEFHQSVPLLARWFERII